MYSLMKQMIHKSKNHNVEMQTQQTGTGKQLSEIVQLQRRRNVIDDTAIESRKTEFFDQLQENQNLYFLEQKNQLRDGPSPAIENWALKIMMDKAKDRLKSIDQQLEKQNTPERNIARLKEQI